MSDPLLRIYDLQVRFDTPDATDQHSIGSTLINVAAGGVRIRFVDGDVHLVHRQTELA